MTELNIDTFAEAIKSDKPCVVDFWADWCMPCRMLAPVLEELSNDMDGTADFYKINIDDFADLAIKYGVESIPTIIVFKNGEEAARSVGVRAREELKEVIESI